MKLYECKKCGYKWEPLPTIDGKMICPLCSWPADKDYDAGSETVIPKALIVTHKPKKSKDKKSRLNELNEIIKSKTLDVDLREYKHLKEKTGADNANCLFKGFKFQKFRSLWIPFHLYETLSKGVFLRVLQDFQESVRQSMINDSSPGKEGEFLGKAFKLFGFSNKTLIIILALLILIGIYFLFLNAVNLDIKAVFGL